MDRRRWLPDEERKTRLMLRCSSLRVNEFSLRCLAWLHSARPGISRAAYRVYAPFAIK